MPYNPQIHHRRSVRLPRHDYGSVGAYFITVCTTGRQHLFGEVVDGVMRLSKLGAIVQHEWFTTAEARPFIQLVPAEFVVMPNHVHGIVWITADGDRVGTADGCVGDGVAAEGFVGDRRGLHERFGRPVPDSIPTIVRAFKAAVTRRINAEQNTPGAPVWQHNYHEHLIRTAESLRRIQQYVADNPARWRDDSWNRR